MLCRTRNCRRITSIRRPCCRFLSSDTSSTAAAPVTTSLRLYRILLRETRVLPNGFLLQRPLDPRDYGQARLFDDSNKTEESEPIKILRTFAQWKYNTRPIIMQWFSTLSSEPLRNVQQNASLWISSRDFIKQAIRLAFEKSGKVQDTLALNRLAMDAFQFLQEQHAMQHRNSVSEEYGIQIVATSRCIGTSVSPSAAAFRFAYRIRIENVSTETVQLLGREWLIEEPNQEPQRVHAPTGGAVGHLPVLKPGQVFEYMSGCDLVKSRRGTMSGFMYMAHVPDDTPSALVGDAVAATENMEEVFQVPVHAFPLVAEK